MIEVSIPGPGYRHVVDAEMLLRFFEIVPDWLYVSRGLRAVILDEGSNTAHSWYEDGVIGLHAWPDPPATSVDAWHFAKHERVWARLGARWYSASEFVGAVPFSPGKEKDSLAAAVGMLRHHFGLFDWALVPGAVGEWQVLDCSDSAEILPVCELLRIDDELHVFHCAVHLDIDREQAAAYVLLHVLFENLEHHIKAYASGEFDVEMWLLRGRDAVWDRFFAAFTLGRGR